MTQSTITAGDATANSIIFTGGDDNTLAIKVGGPGSKVNALIFDALGNATLLGALTQATINNTGASSDITLAVGQLAYVDVSAATTAALKIATGNNQEYEIRLSMQGNTGSAGNCFLNPNNNTFANFFRADGPVASGGSGGVIGGNFNSFILAYQQDTKRAVATASTATLSKTVEHRAWGYTGSTSFYSSGATGWMAAANGFTAGDTTTAWTSLGTVTFPVAATGRISIRRLA
jgi:hypothetical protein